jgi:hypothetical protein
MSEEMTGQIMQLCKSSKVNREHSEANKGI